jgi:hypothetical protein
LQATELLVVQVAVAEALLEALQEALQAAEALERIDVELQAAALWVAL